jgi:hypothetical protein
MAALDALDQTAALIGPSRMCDGEAGAVIGH